MFTHWENSGILISLELTQQLIAEIVSGNYIIEEVKLDGIYLKNISRGGSVVVNNNVKRFGLE